MPFSSRQDLPAPVRKALKDVPHAQGIYKEAYNSAYDQYATASERQAGRSQEETAHAVAWAAVKKKYKKGSDEKWHPKKKQ